MPAPQAAPQGVFRPDRTASRASGYPNHFQHPRRKQPRSPQGEAGETELQKKVSTTSTGNEDILRWQSKYICVGKV